MRPYSPMQLDYIKNAICRWNWKQGAVRAGKTFIDIDFVIPARINNRKGLDGLNVILGVTEMTIQRNVIEPMQQRFGVDLISNISKNVSTMFGERVYCLGAEKISQVSKIQGASFKYVYGDEVAKWNSEVFEMLKSRLDKEYSTFDGTLNPENPSHWLKAFLDNTEYDQYVQKYTIFDNPTLPPSYVENICKEYQGTVYYDRYILGEWKRAEGLCYPEYANSTHEYSVKRDAIPQRLQIVGGIDYGKSKSDSAYVVCGIHNKNLYVLKAESVDAEGKTFEQQKRDFENFMLAFLNDYPQFKCAMCFADSAEPVYNNSLRKSFPDYGIRPSIKRPILDRIRALNILMSARRFFVVDELCKPLVQGLQDAVWDDTQADDVRLDDGTSNIDILDALEYAFEYYIPQLVRLEA